MQNWRMGIRDRRWAYVAKNPMAFGLSVLRAFRDNHVLLLAGALAYYLLLSIVPFLILMSIVLPKFVAQRALLTTLGEYLGRLVPGQSSAVLDELYRFSSQSGTISWILLGTLIFFSSLAFSVLEKSMSFIFVHRIESPQRHFALSAIIPYCFIILTGFGLLIMTLISGAIQAFGTEHIRLLGHTWSLNGMSGVLIYLLGVLAEVILLTFLYIIMPAGRQPWRYALVGASAATVVWEIMRHLLVWYFQTRSQVGLVYGSLASAIIILSSFEILAIVLLLGAQVIAEYVRIGVDDEISPRQ
jgi:YihY family inner membrane protein